MDEAIKKNIPQQGSQKSRQKSGLQMTQALKLQPLKNIGIKMQIITTNM